MNVPWPAYGRSVEHSVYVAEGSQRRGIGRALLEALIGEAQRRGLHAMIGGIEAGNATSLKLHEASGFRVVGRRERIAQAAVGPHAGEWRDTILIERRATADR